MTERTCRPHELLLGPFFALRGDLTHSCLKCGAQSPTVTTLLALDVLCFYLSLRQKLPEVSWDVCGRGPPEATSPAHPFQLCFIMNVCDLLKVLHTGIMVLKLMAVGLPWRYGQDTKSGSSQRSTLLLTFPFNSPKTLSGEFGRVRCC